MNNNNKEEIVRAYSELADRPDWDWFATLTYSKNVNEASAWSIFKKWISAFELAEPRLVWFAVLEKSQLGVPHIHVLLGGIKRSSVRKWSTRWKQRAGIAHLEVFDKARRKNAFRYLLKTITANTTDRIDMNLRKGDNNDGRYGKAPDSKRSSHNPASKRGNPVPLHIATENNRGSVQQQMCSIQNERYTEVVGRANPSEFVTIRKVKVRNGSTFHCERRGKHLVIVLELFPPRPSKSSGKTNVIGSTKGPRATFSQIEGRPIIVNAIAMLNPGTPLFRLRAHAHLARMEGLIS